MNGAFRSIFCISGGSFASLRRSRSALLLHRESFSTRSLKKKERELIAGVGSNRPTIAFDAVNAKYEDREVWEGIATTEECARAVDAARAAMEIACDYDGDAGRLFPPNADEAKRIMGDDAFALFQRLQTKVADTVGKRYGKVEHVNALFVVD